MNDEHLYSQVAEELLQQGPIPGLWAKAFAEANGNDSQAKALYLRYRVSQLAAAERQMGELIKSTEEERMRTEYAQEEKERMALAKSEGITPIHIILVGLPIFFLILLAFRYFNG